MKLITAIVNRKDSARVCKALIDRGYIFTKVATSGGFLQTSNVMLLIGTEDEKVENAVSAIRENSAKRIEPTPASVIPMLGHDAESITVGGATVFVTDVTYYEKM